MYALKLPIHRQHKLCTKIRRKSTTYVSWAVAAVIVGTTCLALTYW